MAKHLIIDAEVLLWLSAGYIMLPLILHRKMKNNGGTWNNTKHRPIVCLIKSKEHDGLYWAIPMGNLNHRDDAGQNGWIFT